MPPETKAGYSYARRNVTLRKWVAALLIALVGLAGLATYGLLNLHQSVISFNQQVATVQANLQKEHLQQTDNQIKDISSSLRLAAQVLSKEVLFSKLITQIGAAMPSGAILASLNINKTTGGLDLIAHATDYGTATQVQVNLANPANQIFAKADIVNITCASSKTVQVKVDPYPCVVTIRALFADKNPFLFINQGAK
ncbi:MAG: hypothetical protein ABI602_00725 [Candidatus Saccharibacteria bacterium]